MRLPDRLLHFHEATEPPQPCDHPTPPLPPVAQPHEAPRLPPPLHGHEVARPSQRASTLPRRTFDHEVDLEEPPFPPHPPCRTFDLEEPPLPHTRLVRKLDLEEPPFPPHPPCRTFDPEEADFFYVPQYGTCYIYPIHGWGADYPWFPAPGGGERSA
eukprot:126635-Chlamydomonas_euryale.AAC.1